MDSPPPTDQYRFFQTEPVLGTRVIVESDETGNPVLFDNHILRVLTNHLLDLDVFVAIGKKKVSAVLPNPLILSEGQGEAFEAAAGRTLTDELERILAAEARRNTIDVLVQHPEQRLVLRETLLTILIHHHPP
jgi:hypothetical protein